MNKKAIGGPLDILHSLVLIVFAIFMIKFALAGRGLPPFASLLFFSFLIICEIAALVL